MQGTMRPSDLEKQRRIAQALKLIEQRNKLPPMKGYCPPFWRQALPWVLFGVFVGWVISAGAYMMWITYQ